MAEIKSNADIEPCLSVVMPVFNEAATVGEVIKTVWANDPCSNSSSWTIARRTALGKITAARGKTTAHQARPFTK